MTDKEMSYEEFEAARSKLYGQVQNQLLLMGKLRYKWRKRLIAHEIRCKSCEDVVIQVVWVNLEDGKLARAIRYRDPEHEGPALPFDMHPGDRARAMAQRNTSYRPGEWRFTVVPADPHPDPYSRPSHLVGDVYSTCECGRHRVKETDLLSRTGHDTTSTPTKLPFA